MARTFGAPLSVPAGNVKDETQTKNDAPDLLYILYKVVIVFDHFNNTLKVAGSRGHA